MINLEKALFILKDESYFKLFDEISSFTEENSFISELKIVKTFILRLEECLASLKNHQDLKQSTIEESLSPRDVEIVTLSCIAIKHSLRVHEIWLDHYPHVKQSKLPNEVVEKENYVQSSPLDKELDKLGEQLNEAQTHLNSLVEGDCQKLIHDQRLREVIVRLRNTYSQTHRMFTHLKGMPLSHL